MGKGAVSAAVFSGPHNVIMGQKGFRQIGAADELPMQFPTSGLGVSDAKLKNDANRIKNVMRVMLEANAFSKNERAWVINYVRDRWRIDAKVAETVYEQWLSTLLTDGTIAIKDLQAC